MFSRIGHLFFFLVIVGIVELFGQDAFINLVVVDAETREPLVAANVYVNGDPAGVTNVNGALNLGVVIGENKLLISYLGYDDYNASFNTETLEGPIFEAMMSPKSTLLMTATVTGSKFEKPLAESTVSIEVLRPQMVQNTAPARMDELIDRIPGVQILDGQANIRGGSGWSYGVGSRVVLLLDDIPMLSGDASRPDWEDLPLENIGQIEVLKGASSALYGSSALNGIINFKTDYAKSDPVTQVSITGTTYSGGRDTTEDWTLSPYYTLLTSIVHKRKMGKLDLILGGLYKNEESFNRGQFSKYGRVSLSMRYRIKENIVLGLNSNINPGKSRDYFYWDQKGSYFGDESSITKTKRLRFNVDPYIHINQGRLKHKFLGRFYRINNDNINNQDNTSSLSYGEYQLQYNNENIATTLTGGVVGVLTNSDSQLYSDTTFKQANQAVYLQVDKKLGQNFSVNGGFRLERNSLDVPHVIDGDTIDSHNDVETKPIFRFGANYKLARATYIRASWGQGYRYPTIAEKFINTNAGIFRIRPNPNVQSEFGWSSEIGLRQGVAGKGWSAYADMSYFISEYEDMMEFTATLEDFTLFFRSENVGGTRIQGLELTTYGQGQTRHGDWQFQMGYLYLDPKFKEFDITGNDSLITNPNLTLAQANAAKSTARDNILKYRTRHNFKADFQWSWKYIFAGVAYNYTSEMEAIDQVFALIPGVFEFREENRKGNHLFEARLGLAQNRWRIQIQAKNIFDVKYTRRPGYLEAPRSFAVRLDYHW